MPRRLGFLVNPIAGLGARVGLKGTDANVEEAVKRGAKAEAGARAARFLADLAEAIEIVTAAGPMGEEAAEAAGASVMIAHVPREPTTSADTREAVRAFLAAGVEAVAFVGGDGTAADVLAALAEAGRLDVPILGIPAGSKMYSSVFADTPEHARAVVASFDDTREGEVLDIDEDAYRRDELKVRLHGVARVPHHRFMQAGKLAGADDEIEQETLGEAIAEAILGEPGLHVVGAGSTLLHAKRALGLAGTLLGIDVVRVAFAPAEATDGSMSRVATLATRDANEADLLALPAIAAIHVSPIGGQGFFLGRGNLPISPAVLKRAGLARVRVHATPSKLVDTPTLKVDTGDPELDRSFPVWIRVTTGHHTTRLARVSA